MLINVSTKENVMHALRGQKRRQDALNDAVSNANKWLQNYLNTATLEELDELVDSELLTSRQERFIHELMIKREGILSALDSTRK